MDSERKSALSFRDLERLGEGAVKKAFRSFRQILIVLLYVVAIFFVLNDFSFTVTSAEQFVRLLPRLRYSEGQGGRGVSDRGEAVP